MTWLNPSKAFVKIANYCDMSLNQKFPKMQWLLKKGSKFIGFVESTFIKIPEDPKEKVIKQELCAMDKQNGNDD